jgi:hypothetical protein
MGTNGNRVSEGIRAWMMRLNDEPGWREWSRSRTGRVMYFDDPLEDVEDLPREYVFRPPLDKQHTVIIQYLGLQQSANVLRQCEYYFRRYPFRGLLVTRHEHLTNICEMYFSRIFELKERIKKYLNALATIPAPDCMDIGKFIKQFEKEFDQEIRARNSVHHHERFEDVTLARLFLTETIIKGAELNEYRRLSREWVHRVRRRSAKADQFLEAVAEVTLLRCDFLKTQGASEGKVYNGESS